MVGLWWLACADLSGTSTGTAVAVGDGEAWTFADTDDDGVTTRLGVVLEVDALQGLPTADTEWVLALPDGLDLAPFDHVGLGWLPVGHDPLGIWDEPHFDVHFFLVSETERAAIDIDDERITAEPPPETVPPGYSLAPGSAVAGQGSHWVDITTGEWAGEPFTGSLVFGSWDATWTFFEPMITWSALVAGSELTGEVPWPETWQAPGRYPRAWSVAEGERGLDIALDGLE